MTSETTAQEAQSDNAQQTNNRDPLQVFGSIFRQQLDRAIEPIMENIQSQTRANSERASDAISQGTGGLAPTGAASRNTQNASHVLSLTVDRPQVEGALQTILDRSLDVLFSDDLQQVYRDRSRHMVRSLLTTARHLASDEQSFDVKSEQFAESLDTFIEASFSDSLREETRRHGEQAIQRLVALNGPAAKRAGTELLSNLETQRFAAAETFWKHLLETVLKASQATTQSTNGKAKEGAHASDLGTREDMPQTLARSDKRAQEIWLRARDKAAEKDGPGVGAERVAYTTLKERYEKKGDRWVKKSSE